MLRSRIIKLDTAVERDDLDMYCNGFAIRRASSPDVEIKVRFKGTDYDYTIRPGDGLEANTGAIGQLRLSHVARPGHWVELVQWGDASVGDMPGMIKPMRLNKIDDGIRDIADYNWYCHAGKVQGDWASVISDPGWTMFTAPEDVILTSLSVDISTTNVWEIRHQKAGAIVTDFTVLHKLYFASIDRAIPQSFNPYKLNEGDKINIFNDGTAASSFLLYFEYRFRSLARK